MMTTIGPEGTITIDKKIRDQLGVEPGWEVVQLLRDGVLEIHFLPPARVGVAAGILGPVANAPWVEDEDALHEATEWAIGEAMREKYSQLDAEAGS